MITRWPTWTPACSGTPPPAHPQRDPVVVDDRTSERLERSSCRGLDGGQGQSLITSLLDEDQVVPGQRSIRAYSQPIPSTGI